MIVLLFGWAESFNFEARKLEQKGRGSRYGPFVVLNEISCLGRLLTPTGLKLPRRLVVGISIFQCEVLPF